MRAVKKTCQVQAHILYLSRIEIPTLVGNLELKTLSRGRKLGMEILSQWLGSLFLIKVPTLSRGRPPPHPPPPLGYKIHSCITRLLNFWLSFCLAFGAALRME